MVRPSECVKDRHAPDCLPLLPFLNFRKHCINRTTAGKPSQQKGGRVCVTEAAGTMTKYCICTHTVYLWLQPKNKNNNRSKKTECDDNGTFWWLSINQWQWRNHSNSYKYILYKPLRPLLVCDEISGCLWYVLRQSQSPLWSDNECSIMCFVLVKRGAAAHSGGVWLHGFLFVEHCLENSAAAKILYTQSQQRWLWTLVTKSTRLFTLQSKVLED